MDYYLYRIDETGEGDIYGKFHSLSAAAMSAKLLMIEELSFILSGDMNRVYFFNKDRRWDYDLLTERGKLSFLDMYPSPYDYT